VWTALTVRGPERRACAQAAKAGVAAVVAWLLAADVFGMPQPFLAPYTAIYLVEATVYRSLLSAAQQVGAVAAGVLLAAGVGAVLPTPAGIGVATVVGLLLGRWRRLGPNGTWIALTALLVLAVGADSDRVLLVDRLAETVLGAVVGTAVNALLLPPTYRVRAGAAAARAGAELAGLVDDLAAWLRGSDPPADRDGWVTRVLAARETLDSARELTGLGTENRRIRPRRSTDPRQVPQERFHRAVCTLDAVWPHLRHLAESVGAAASHDGPLTYPTEAARADFAAVLDDLAEALRLVAAHQDHLDRVAALVDRCRERLDELDAHISTSAADSRGVLLGLAGMTVPTRRALDELSA
jgi:hypothetical protein